MIYDPEKVDDVVLAVLMLGASGNRAWKGIDNEAMARLFEKGWISDPQSKSPTLVLSDEGLERGKQMAAELFGMSG